MTISSLPPRRTPTEQVAEEVRALMARRGVTQMQLRDVLGVSQPAISARLHGKVAFDANEIGLLAEFFGVSPGVLFGAGGGGGPDGGLSMTTQRYPYPQAA